MKQSSYVVAMSLSEGVVEATFCHCGRMKLFAYKLPSGGEIVMYWELPCANPVR